MSKKTEITKIYTSEDSIMPFTVETLGARGRVVRLSAELDKLLKRHNYPAPVAALLGQAAALTVLLGNSLKFEGKFSLQTQTDGLVPTIVCDYIAPQKAGASANFRAYARFNAEKLDKLSSVNQAELLGNGTLAFTIDQGAQMQLYQGIVQLDSMNLEEAAQRYFAQSEQIPTKIRLSSAILTGRDKKKNLYSTQRAGGILVQYLPKSSTEKDTAGNQTAGNQQAEGNNTLQSASDKWREAELLTTTVEDTELTDPQLSVEQLLYRLFHEQGVRIFLPQKIIEKCSCSRQKLFDILAGFSDKDRTDSVENGKIRAKCEFCSAVYEFSPDEFVKDKNK